MAFTRYVIGSIRTAKRILLWCLQTLPPIIKHSQSTGDVRAPLRDQRKLPTTTTTTVTTTTTTTQCQWEKPVAPTPVLLHLGLTARTHDVGEFRQNFPELFDRFFVDRSAAAHFVHEGGG